MMLLMLRAVNKNSKMIRNRNKKGESSSQDGDKPTKALVEKDLWVAIRLYTMGCTKFQGKWKRRINICRDFSLGDLICGVKFAVPQL